MSYAKYAEDNDRIVTEREGYMYGAWFNALTTIDKKHNPRETKTAEKAKQKKYKKQN